MFHSGIPNTGLHVLLTAQKFHTARLINTRERDWLRFKTDQLSTSLLYLSNRLGIKLLNYLRLAKNIGLFDAALSYINLRNE